MQAEWAERCNIQMVYMVYHNNQVYHGGTAQGCQFLSEDSDISRRFSSAIYSEGAGTRVFDNSYNTEIDWFKFTCLLRHVQLPILYKG